MGCHQGFGYVLFGGDGFDTVPSNTCKVSPDLFMICSWFKVKTTQILLASDHAGSFCNRMFSVQGNLRGLSYSPYNIQIHTFLPYHLVECNDPAVREGLTRRIRTGQAIAGGPDVPESGSKEEGRAPILRVTHEPFSSCVIFCAYPPNFPKKNKNCRLRRRSARFGARFGARLAPRKFESKRLEAMPAPQLGLRAVKARSNSAGRGAGWMGLGPSREGASPA